MVRLWDSYTVKVLKYNIISIPKWYDYEFNWKRLDFESNRLFQFQNGTIMRKGVVVGTNVFLTFQFQNGTIMSITLRGVELL